MIQVRPSELGLTLPNDQDASGRTFGAEEIARLTSVIESGTLTSTKGAQVPWNASRLPAPFYFFERAPDAPPPPVSPEQTSAIRSKPIRDFDVREAYLAALDRDNLQDYESFLVAYPRDPMARRVRAIVAARREAITWRRSRSVDTPAAYWSYLRRYPNGFHANDARRRLAYLTAALEPPPRFDIISYDVPPPPPEDELFQLYHMGMDLRFRLRIGRIGQTKVVNVYRLIARDSVEEKILLLSEKKRELVANVLSTEDTGLKGMTKQDVESLFAD